MTTAIWWIRRDLRLTDNPTLHTALSQSEFVVPLFVLDPKLLGSAYASERRLAFLLASLRNLDEVLKFISSRLVIRHGDPQAELQKVLNEAKATKIFAEADHSSYARQRDEAVAQTLPLELVEGVTMFPPTAVLKDNGTPYTVFTPFSKKWKTLPRPRRSDLLPRPQVISTPKDLMSASLPSHPKLPMVSPFSPGEVAALEQLNSFTSGNAPQVYHYRDKRDRPDLPGTSQLSPYLRFGLISARQAVVAADEALARAPDAVARKGAETWLNELIWREFYITILYHFPHVRQKSFRPALENIPWDNDETHFNAWCEGQTGYPIVDAAMRQLRYLGWMHNRARMITASFLVKDLLIDWRWGEKWFMQQLVDGDPAANNGGWQWTAGTGTDAAPYFRIFNPTLQGKKFDPNGAYVRRWVPELATVPTKFIHEPAKMPLSEQHKSGCIIGQDYPVPIVDHAVARKRTLAAYDQAKNGVRQPSLF